MSDTKTPQPAQQADEANPQRDLVPAIPHQEDDDDTAMIARWNSNAPISASNMPQSGPAGRAMVTQAMASTDKRTRDVIGQELSVKGYVAHVAEITDTQTGEIKRKLRIVLFLTDGTTLSTMSNACVRAIRFIASQADQHEWDPPIRIKIRTHPLPEGKSYCDLIELPPIVAAAKTAKK